MNALALPFSYRLRATDGFSIRTVSQFHRRFFEICMCDKVEEIIISSTESDVELRASGAAVTSYWFN